MPAKVAEKAALAEAVTQPGQDLEAVGYVIRNASQICELVPVMLQETSTSFEGQAAQAKKRVDELSHDVKGLVRFLGEEQAIRALARNSEIAPVLLAREIIVAPVPSIHPFMVARSVAPDRSLLLISPQGPPSTEIERLATKLKAIAHPKRLLILQETATGPINGATLAGTLGLTEATVHHHTAILRAAGLVRGERQGGDLSK